MHSDVFSFLPESTGDFVSLFLKRKIENIVKKSDYSYGGHKSLWESQDPYYSGNIPGWAI